jgi:hypothetical protein
MQEIKEGKMINETLDHKDAQVAELKARVREVEIDRDFHLGCSANNFALAKNIAIENVQLRVVLEEVKKHFEYEVERNCECSAHPQFVCTNHDRLKEINAALNSPAETPKTSFDVEFFLKIVRDWKHSWMDQRQNSEADFQNYYNRAFKIDSNMVHSLAKRLDDAINKAKGEDPRAAGVKWVCQFLTELIDENVNGSMYLEDFIDHIKEHAGVYSILQPKDDK